MYRATGIKTGKVYATDDSRPKLMRQLSIKYRLNNGRTYPEPITITCDKPIEKTDKQLKRELLFKAVEGDKAAIKEVRGICRRKKGTGLNNPHAVKVKITYKNGKTKIVESLAEASRFLGISPTAVIYRADKGHKDKSGLKIERLGKMED